MSWIERIKSNITPDDEEFMAMYEQYEAFDELEEQFMDMEESVTARIAEYVDNHIEEWAEIAKNGRGELILTEEHNDL